MQAADQKKKPPLNLPSRSVPIRGGAAQVPPGPRLSNASTTEPKPPATGRLPDVPPPAPSSEAKAVEARTAVAKPRAAKPADVTPAGSRVPDPRRADARRVDAKPADAKPADAKPAATKPAKPTDVKLVDSPPIDATLADVKPMRTSDRPRKSSLRPGPKTPSATPSPLFLDGFDEGSIAFAFDALVSEDRPSSPGTHEFDLAPVRELFAELAANHMRHVRDFMIDVKWGEVMRDWIHICVPPVRTLRRAAERLDLVELAAALEAVGKELDVANAAGGQMLDAQEKQRLLDAYEELVRILPQAFALDRDRTQREAVIVQALLLQVPDVRKVTIDKLHAAGLTSLAVLFEANAHDIAHVADIPHALATRIVDRVQAYRAELQSSSPQDARAAEREKLAGLNGQLKQHHDAYEEAANGWGPEAKAKKRDHFRAREETWLEISVLLARFGEVDRLQGIEKVPYAQRIAQLSEYLEEARDMYRNPDA